ncbi:Plant intracellular Ras-group- LRR protein 6 [Dionaea muscipula]
MLERSRRSPRWPTTSPETNSKEPGVGRVHQSRAAVGSANYSNKLQYSYDKFTAAATRTDDEEEEEEAASPDQIVDLSGMSLDSSCLPNPLSLMVNLAAISKLDLSNNNLQSIPESVAARLLNVVVLDVHSNQLTSLPNSIGCSSKLKALDVSGNLLHSLPKTIENCRALEDLAANFNKLTTLPDAIGFELLNLRRLSVNSNKLIFLPYSISHMTSLRILDVRLNCLRSLPDDLENLINLEILNVSQNFQYLSDLPNSIGLLLSLLELDVSYNNITTLPASMGCLKRLQKLSVEGNPLISPPKDVMEEGLHAVKRYLSEKINGAHQDSPKKRSWFGQLKKFSTFNGHTSRASYYESKRGTTIPECRPIDALASPRYLAMLSPRRLFSPKNQFTRLSS